MVKITEKDRLLLKIVGENNNLKLRLRLSSKEDKKIFEEAYKLLLPLGTEIIDYSNFLCEEELQDFLKLYESATVIYNSKEPVAKREEETKLLIQMINDSASVLHELILPSLGSDEFVQGKMSIDKKINDLTANLDYAEMSFSYVDQFIDRILAEQKEPVDNQKLILIHEFRKLKSLLEFVKEYYDGVLKIIRSNLNENSSNKDIEDINNKLKSVEKMILYIESSFNTIRISKIIKNNTDLEALLEQEDFKVKR